MRENTACRVWPQVDSLCHSLFRLIDGSLSLLSLSLSPSPSLSLPPFPSLSAHIGAASTFGVAAWKLFYTKPVIIFVFLYVIIVVLPSTRTPSSYFEDNIDQLPVGSAHRSCVEVRNCGVEAFLCETCHSSRFSVRIPSSFLSFYTNPVIRLTK